MEGGYSYSLLGLLDLLVLMLHENNMQIQDERKENSALFFNLGSPVAPWVKSHLFSL